MKRLLLITIPLMLFSCSKMQTGPAGEPALTSSSNAVTGYVVGIMPSQNGDATVNNLDMVAVPAGTTVTVTALPASSDYVIDHWVQTSSQGASSGQNVHWYENSFTFKVTGETWFKPVFRYAPVSETVNVLLSFMVADFDFVSQTWVDYSDERGLPKSEIIPPAGPISHEFQVRQGSDITVNLRIYDRITGYRYVYCMYWENSNQNVLDWSGDGPLTNTRVISSIYSDMSISIRAELEDFRESITFSED